VGKNRSYVIKTDERFKILFQSMITAPEECRLEYLGIKVAELLFLLENTELPRESDKGSLMTEDLSHHYFIEAMVSTLGISASSLKNYF
jgi:hypothetical protein